MAGILALVLVALLVGRKEYRLFAGFYAVALLIASSLRSLLLDYGVVSDGKDFFEYYSIVQMVFIIGAASLLRDKERLCSIGLFLLFSIYNIMVYWFWGNIPITYYDQISLMMIGFQANIVTYADEKTIGPKSVAIGFTPWILEYLVPRYI